MKVVSAIYSGVCAALASLFGKLSGLDFMFLSVTWRYITKAIFFVMMLLLNGIGWTSFVRSMHNSRAVIATLAVGSSINFVLSGMLAFIFFSETSGTLWWLGVCLIALGVIIVSCSSRYIRRNLRPLPKEVDKTSYPKGVTGKLPDKDQ